MNFTSMISILLLVTSSAFASGLDTAKIEQITGLKGKLNDKEGVFKVAQPRSDVKVTVDGWSMPPFMGLTSWAGFSKGRKSDLMVMGDLVLFQDEVNPVMSVLFEHGIDVTALHNHFFSEDPKVFFMHIGGEGSLEHLAQALRSALDRVKEIRKASGTPSLAFGEGSLPKTNSISAQPLEVLFGQPGDSKDGMFKETFGRKAKMPCGCDASKDMGVNTWAAFAGTDENALVEGDFAVLETELQPVLRSLRSSGIIIVAIHHHMVQERPRILFLHYWGRGKALELARAIQKAKNFTKQ